MAQCSISVDLNQLSCPICQGLLKDPVTIPCGHSYCMDCIKDWWDNDDHVGVYKCIQCQQTFYPRPVLGKNTKLAEVIEKMNPENKSGPETVACDVCPGSTQKAVKSCLVCVASYCETHLRPHYESPALQKHKLTDATGKLQEMFCMRHNKLLEVYCRTDQQCVCLLCVMDEHRNHDTVSTVAEWAEKQKELIAEQRKFQQKIQQREEELQNVTEGVKSFTRSAQAAVDDSDKIFDELICYLTSRRSRLKELIRDQERTATGTAEDLLKRLKQEIADLKKRDAELEQLIHTEEQIRFLQSWQSLSAPCGSSDLPCTDVSPYLSFEPVSRAISELKRRLDKVCEEEFIKISETVSKMNEVDVYPSPKGKTRAVVLPVSATHRRGMQELKCRKTGSSHGPSVSAEDVSPAKWLARAVVLPVNATCRGEIPELKSREKGSGHGPPVNKIHFLQTQEPSTREEFLWYACQLTLDPNTAHEELSLSGDYREVTRVQVKQDYPSHPERFTKKCQVLCKEALSGRQCYWEVEVKGNRVEIGVTYKRISRKGKGKLSSFGGNANSWSLDCIHGAYSVCHDYGGIKLSVPYSQKVGVYLDHPAGTLSFYSVSDVMTLIHKFENNFTEPLYVGFWIDKQCTVKLVNCHL